MLELPPHIEFARSRDWDVTPMGPIETWSGDLRIMVPLSDLIPIILLTSTTPPFLTVAG